VQILTSGVGATCVSGWTFLPTVAIVTIVTVSTCLRPNRWVLVVVVKRALIILTSVEFLHDSSVNILLSFVRGSGSKPGI
jgi:hypothetical protein